MHLGFFRALIGFYLVYPFLIRIFTKCRESGWLKYYFAAAAVLQISWKVLNNIQFEAVWISYLLMGTMFLRYLVYFSLGMAAYYYKKEFLEWIGRSRKFLVWLLIIFIPLVTVSRFKCDQNPSILLVWNPSFTYSPVLCSTTL